MGYQKLMANLVLCLKPPIFNITEGENKNEQVKKVIFERVVRTAWLSVVERVQSFERQRSGAAFHFSILKHRHPAKNISTQRLPLI